MVDSSRRGMWLASSEMLFSWLLSYSQSMHWLCHILVLYSSYTWRRSVVICVAYSAVSVTVWRDILGLIPR